MCLVKLYRDELYAAAVYYEAEEMAREGFEQIKSRLGNPHVTWKFSMVFNGREVGETTFRLGEFDRVELVELVVTDEKLLDSYELSGEKQE